MAGLVMRLAHFCSACCADRSSDCPVANWDSCGRRAEVLIRDFARCRTHWRLPSASVQRRGGLGLGLASSCDKAYHKCDCSCQHPCDHDSYYNCDMDTLAERLKRLRDAAGMTQEALAKKAGLKNPSIIGMLETGKRHRSSHIPALASALGVDALQLQFGSRIFPSQMSKSPSAEDPCITAVVAMMRATDKTGREVALGAVRVALSGYQPTRQANGVQ